MNTIYSVFSLFGVLLAAEYTHATTSPVEKFSFNSTLEYKVHRGSPADIVAEGVAGAGVNLTRSCLEISIKRLKNKGTISFWMKPDWGYYDNTNSALTSHTFLSMRWKNGGYLSLSDGWWEDTGGALNTYFVFNNRDLLNTHSKIKYRKNTWSHLAVTWDSQSNELRLFHNGKLSASKTQTFGVRESFSTLYLGCDKGAYPSKGRYVNAVVDELEIYDVALSEDEIGNRINELSIEVIGIERLSVGDRLDKKKVNTGEIRAVFDSYPASWQTKDQADATVKRLYESGINVYMPCVWYGDGTRFDSVIAPHAKYKGDGKPLAYLINVAHKYGIEVHPWITVAFRSPRRSPEFLRQYYDNGTPPNAFEVHKKSFRDFMVSLAHELITNYDIDGINLDFIRSMGISKSQFVLREFKKKYKKTLSSQLERLDSKQKWPSELQEFINKPIDDIVNRIFQLKVRYKPDIIISVDGHPEPLFMGESRQGRNELKWLNSGVIDIVFAMEYSMNIDYERIDLVKKDAIDPARVIVLIGAFNKTKPNTSRSVEHVEQMIKFSRARWDNGVALYPYYFITEELHSSLADGLFSIKSKPEWPR